MRSSMPTKFHFAGVRPLLNAAMVLGFGVAALHSDLLPRMGAAPPEEAETALQDVNSRLQTVFRQLVRNVSDPRTKEDVKKAHSAWQTFSAAEATARAGVTSKGGSAYSSDRTQVLLELTEERLRQLREQLRLARGEPAAAPR